jgi:hypothetical protein
MGCAVAFTPSGTGKVMVTITGYGNTSTAAVTFNVGARFGTGTAPVNGAAVTGTILGLPSGATAVTLRGQGTGLNASFAFTDVLTLTPGTAYWFDLAALTSAGADQANLLDLAFSIAEI